LRFTFCFRESPRFRAALLVALVAAAGNAALRQHDRPDVAGHRTARYAATLLERENDGDGSSLLTLELGGRAAVQARVQGEVSPRGAQLIVPAAIQADSWQIHQRTLAHRLGLAP
jgi:hypothetical protein